MARTSTEQNFVVRVEEMIDGVSYVVPGTHNVVQKGGNLPYGLRFVHLLYDLPTGEVPPTTQQEALEMCDLA